MSQGGLWQSTIDGKVVSLQGYLGRGGFEGIQNDDLGNLYIVEDVGGSTFSGTTARRPNSFLYRFLPNDPSDLTKGGKIQALQVLRSGEPITFADGGTGVNPAAYLDLHKYGNSFQTKWITLTTTSSSTAQDPDDNVLAKTIGGNAFQAAGERSVPSRLALHRVLLRRDR